MSFEVNTVIDLSGEGIGQLENPQSLSVSFMGDIYIADTGHNRIVKLDAKGNYANHVGGFGWKNNQFDAPVDIFAIDGLNIYVADLNNQRIQRYSKKLEYVSSFGGSKLTELSIDASRTSNEPLGYPSGIAVSSQGDLFYSDSEKDQIVKINRFGKKESAFGGFSEGRGTLRSPGKIFVTSRFVYVIDENRVVVFDYYGNYIRDVGMSVLKKPADITIDKKDRIYVADAELRTVVVYDSAGNFLTSLLSHAFDRPVSVDCVLNKLYVLDGKAASIIVFNILESGD
ncbi:NHL repeat-containing protein [bacterium]|nr:NHL repeat-containing protein [bacterium]